MKYLIIGLGIYGSNLARDLAEQGSEVIGVDVKRQRVDDVKDAISTVYCIDSTDPQALSMLPLNNIDVVVVAIGENFGASIKTVALLKQYKVQHIFARAIDPLHQAILQSFEIDRILRPEQRAATELALEMMLGGQVLVMSVAGARIIAQMHVPEYFAGKSYNNIRHDRDIEIVAAARPVEKKSIIGTRTTEYVELDLSTDSVAAGDRIIVLTTRANLYDLMRRTS